MSNEVIPYERMERMALSVAKSGLFACKDQNQALTLMLVAQAEGIHPVKALMEYHVISGMPSLKAYTMLSRFQSSGGKVEWLHEADDKVSGKFTHPRGTDTTSTWDTARVQTMGLEGRNKLHKTNPLQMKRARCISEGIKACYPACLPAGFYTPEEISDIQTEQAPVNSASTEEASVSAAVNKLPDAEAELFKKRIEGAPDTETLKVRYAAAYQSAKEIGDEVRMSSFKTSYDWRQGELTQPAATEPPEEARGTDGEVI